jgi:predicted glycoside hydrolase/deacetylase ChbG (UPF0249 family)
MTRAETLTVVYPMWNEENSIHLAVEAAHEACQTLVRQGELGDYGILVVDDASSDATPAIADAIAAADPRVAVVHHQVNRGLGGALKTGLTNASGDLVLYTDADLPCDLLEALAKAVRLIRLYDADIVSAYRHDRTAEGPRRAVYSFAYNMLVRAAFNLRVRDVNFAFKLFRRRVLDSVELESEGSFIDAELLVRAHQLGYHVIQFGVDYFPRTRGVSTLSSAPTIARILRELSSMWGELRAIRPVPAPDAAALRVATGIAPARRRRRDRRRTRQRDRRERRLLIVNADDYGLTEGVSRGILRAHREGVVTSTSVLAVAPAFATTARWLADADGIGIGVHFAAVGEDPPLLSAREVPTLVDRRGRLPLSWRTFLRRAAAGRIDPEDLRREFETQLARVRDLGLRITHLDTHQHLHLWPSVRDVVLSLARAHGIGAVRVPRSARLFPGAGVNYLAAELARRARTAGLQFPAHAAGLDEAGALDTVRFRQALGRLAAADAPSVELSAHPGEEEDPDRDRYRWSYRWGDELEVLTSPSAREAIQSSGFLLGTYADLARFRQEVGSP